MVVEPGFDVARSGMFPGATVSASAIARYRFSRPPVTHLPASTGTGSTEFSTICLMSRFVAFGKRAQRSAQAPATYGADIEVPDWRKYPPPIWVERIRVPGAARSTEVRP